MKVEKARPEKEPTGSVNAEKAVTEKNNRPGNRGRSSLKREKGVLPGVELPKDRKVKRGWTEPDTKEGRKSKAGKKHGKHESARKPSAYTDGPECLFKTKAPPNANTDTLSNSVDETETRKRKRADAEKSLVVHEFDKSTKYPTFLRNESKLSAKRSTSAYVDGKGWIDDNGEIVEAEQSTRRTRSKAKNTGEGNGALGNTQPKAAESDSKGAVPRSKGTTDAELRQDRNDRTSARGVSSSENEQDAIESGKGALQKSQPGYTSARDGEDSQDEVNTDQVRALSICRSSPTPSLEPVNEVHPLETLFKRPRSAASQTPRKPPLEVKTAFNFFDPEVDQDNSGGPMVVPQTPFTRQDFQERRLRSAAPTPDTAAPSRTTFGRIWSQDSGQRDDVSDGEEDDAGSTPKAPINAVKNGNDGEAKESEFAKWFYEHRGETNRAWKRRRREAAKEKRQRESKRR